MRVAVFGAGYVGLVTGACFAELGHDVVVRDVVKRRSPRCSAGEVPIHEVGLEELLERNRERLTFTIDVGEAVEGADVVYIASARRRCTPAMRTCPRCGPSSTSSRRSTAESSSR